MSKAKLVHCRYPKCSKLHESTELNKDDAIKAGSKNSYYHPDCYHTMQTVSQIRDLFIKEINPLLTGQQIGVLVSTINNIVFAKNVSVDYVKFAVEYFIKYKPGALKYPHGLHYIIQDKDVVAAWRKKEESEIRAKMKADLERIIQKEDKGEVVELNFPESATTYKQSNKSRFSKILGV